MKEGKKVREDRKGRERWSVGRPARRRICAVRLSLALTPTPNPHPQLISGNKIYYLTAESPSLLEEWIRVLQSLLKVQVTGPPALHQGGTKPAVKGWLTKVQVELGGR